MTELQAKTVSILSLRNAQMCAEEAERRRNDERSALLNDGQIEEIILGAIRARETAGKPPPTDVELQAVINTFIGDIFRAGCIELAGKGLVDVVYDPTAPPEQRIDFVWRSDLTDKEKKEILDACQARKNKAAEIARSLRRGGGQEAVDGVPAVG